MSVSGLCDWKFTTLGECADWYSGGTPDTSNPEYWNGDVPWITASSLHSFYIWDSERRVTQLGLLNGTRLMPVNTIIFVVRGMSLKSEFRVGIARRPVAFGQDCKAIIAHKNIEPLFLANVLRAKQNEILGLVSEASHGTGRLETDAVKRVIVPIPPLPEQRAIAHILGTLDDKIELNRKMNETLEAIARALFKSWFVDFDPVRAKAEGRQSPGMDAETAALFSDAFEDSGLGEIPRGWRVGRLDDLIVLQRGFDLPVSERVPGKYPILTASGLAGTHHEFKVRGPGITTGRSGLLGQVYFVHEDFWPHNTSLWVKEFRNSRPHHAYFAMQQVDFSAFNAGSAVPTLNRNHVHNLPSIVPPLPVVEKFERVVAPIFCKKRQDELQSSTLAALRDALLPKLTSGHVRVKDAKEQETHAPKSEQANRKDRQTRP